MNVRHVRQEENECFLAVVCMAHGLPYHKIRKEFKRRTGVTWGTLMTRADDLMKLHRWVGYSSGMEDEVELLAKLAEMRPTDGISVKEAVKELNAITGLKIEIDMLLYLNRLPLPEEIPLVPQSGKYLVPLKNGWNRSVAHIVLYDADTGHVHDSRVPSPIDWEAGILCDWYPERFIPIEKMKGGSP